tara:strand:+ start:892 stop:1026 length:135 start_codon:yes stop_codon:yes gene_type:complete
MEGFTQFCIWFLFASLVFELAWKGLNKYKELKEKELEEKNKNKD